MCDAADTSPSFPRPLPDDPTWNCPVCDAEFVHRRRPGRRKVYCSNACRQRAYRWRRRHQVITTHTNAQPAERGTSRTGLGHAVRTDRDFVAHSGRGIGLAREEVSVCGVLVRPCRVANVRHYRFVTDAFTCQTCESLTAAEPTPPFEWPIPPRRPHPPMWPWPTSSDDTDATPANHPRHPDATWLPSRPEAA